MSKPDNDEQREFWSGPSGESWVQFEAAQDQLLEAVADLVIGRARLSSGERVLDIGCGTGALSVKAAEEVGPTGRLLACDISEPLLTRAAHRLSPFPQAAVLLGDAATLDWPEPGFDVALSRFGVMFFADPLSAFANIARALKPGGRVVFAAWAPARENPYWSIPAKRARDRLGQPPRTLQDTPGPMGLADLDLALSRLRQGGLSDVTGEVVEVLLRLPGGAAAAADLVTQLGPASRALTFFNAGEADRQVIAAEITDDFAQYEVGGEVAIPAKINLLTAIVA